MRIVAATLCILGCLLLISASDSPPVETITTNGGHPLNRWRQGACIGTFSGVPGSGEFGWPVQSGARWRSGYRFRDIRYPPHNGTDFGLWWGGAVAAADSGIVVFAGWWGASGYGNLIVLDHLNGWQTWYGHLSRVLVNCGARARKGDVIGRGGSTGWSTGSHLHFEIRFNGIPIDPLTILGR